MLTPYGRGWPNGDLIFQDRPGPLSELLKQSADTPFTHVEIVRPTGGGFFVADATPEQGMFEEPIDEFIEKGRNGQYWIYRHDGLPYPPEENHPAVASAYATHYMTAFDPFYMPGDVELYGAEFIYVIYGENGVDLGQMTPLHQLGIQTASDLRTLFGDWENHHPVCQKAGLAPESCKARMQDFEIITPASIANDDDLDLVYTNAAD